MEIAFGTYRLQPSEAQRRVETVLELGIRRIDAAQLYKNERPVFDAIRRFESRRPTRVHVTSKIYKNLRLQQVLESVAASMARLGRPIDTMLLHRMLPFRVWRALNTCADQGLVREIGVSNHSPAQLRSLLDKCDGAGISRPTVNQVEFHPFVGAVHPMLSLCKTNGIRVEGHTMLVRGELFPQHPHAPGDLSDVDAFEDTAAYVEAIANRFREDLAAMAVGLPVSKTALALPTQSTRELLTDPIAQQIARRLFPPTNGKPEHSSYDRYRALVRSLRRYAHGAKHDKHHVERPSSSARPFDLWSRYVNDEPVAGRRRGAGSAHGEPKARHRNMVPRGQRHISPSKAWVHGRFITGTTSVVLSNNPPAWFTSTRSTEAALRESVGEQRCTVVKRLGIELKLSNSERRGRRHSLKPPITSRCPHVRWR